MDNNNIEQLKDNIREYIKQNGNKEITGQILQEVLLGMVDGLVGNDSVANPEGEAAEILEKIKIGETIYEIPQNISNKGLLYGGVIYPESDITPDVNCYYVVASTGYYESFDVTVHDYEKLPYLSYDADNGLWIVEYFDIYTYAYAHGKFDKVTELDESTIQVDSAQDFTNAERLQALANVSNQDAEYDSSEPPVFTGKMGYVVLQPEKRGDVTTTFAAQIAGNTNTIFEIRDVYDLDENSVTIPSGCILKFNGGIIDNGVINTNGCFIDSDKKCFGDNISFAANCKIANVSSKLSWFCDNNGSADYGLVNAGAISNDVFVDLEKVTLSHPITYTVSKRIRGLVGKQTTSLIIATNDFSQGDALANALIIFDVNLQTNDGLFDLALDGNFKAKYGFFGYRYVSKVQRCSFTKFILAAIYINGSEDSDISYNYITYSGCGIYATSYAVPDDNLVKFTMQTHTGAGNLTELRIHHNYIVYTNYGIIANPIGTGSEIRNNCISESSCYSCVINSDRNLLFDSNYIESAGISNFFIKEGITWSELYSQISSHTMCTYFSESHEDIFGITMNGWGVPYTVGETSLKLRASVLLRADSGIVTISNNGWSTNQIRTSPDDATIVNDDTAIGIDSVLSVGGSNSTILFSRNRMNFTTGGVSYVPKYMITGFGYFLIGTADFHLPKIKVSDNYGKFDKLECIYNLPKTAAPSYFCSELEVIGNPNAIIVTKPINLVNSCYEHTNNPYTSNVSLFSQNIHKMADGDTMLIDNIPMFMLPKVHGYSYISRGVDFLLPKPDYNFMISVRLYNDEDVTKNVQIQLRNINEYPTVPTNLIMLSSIQVPSKEYKDYSFIVAYEYLNDYSVIVVIDGASASGSEPPASYNKIYTSVPYITPVDSNLSLSLASEKTDEFGILTVGSTADRPTGVNDGFEYFDTDLNKKVVWNGNGWYNVNGNPDVRYNIDNQLTTGIVIEGNPTEVDGGLPFVARLSSSNGFEVKNVNVVMDGIDITSMAFIDSKIYIPCVTGDIVLIGGEIIGNYLTFEAKEANSTIAMQTVGTAPTVSLEYSTDGENWTAFVVGTTTITLANVGDKVMMRGNNSCTSSNITNYNKFVMTGSIAASGDVTSLFNGIGGLFDFTTTSVMNSLFYGCTALTTAPRLMFGTITNNGCSGMFQGCSNIEGVTYVHASSIPTSATCFNAMFNGCSKVDGYVFDKLNASTYVFYNNSACKTFVIKETTPATLASTTISGLPKETCTIYVPYSEDHSILAAYKTTGEWKNWYDAAMLPSRTTEAIQELDENGEIPT